MVADIRVVIIHEEQGYGAGSPQLPEFYLVGPTVSVLEAALPAALEAFCGEPVVYRIVVRPNAD